LADYRWRYLRFLLALILVLMQDKSLFIGIRLTSRIYVEFIRNTPFVVQMFFVAFGLPLLLDLQWSFYISALLAITLNFSAYFAEIISSGIGSTHRKDRNLIDFEVYLVLTGIYMCMSWMFIFLLNSLKQKAFLWWGLKSKTC
jgi:His/Glu/Gln/Arg/opine family amino acid ABC transporter permease subunit